MDEPGGAQSWVNEEFVSEKEAEGYTLAVEASAPKADLGDLSSKAKSELVRLGKGFGLDIDMRMKRDELIVAIEGISPAA